MVNKVVKKLNRTEFKPKGVFVIGSALLPDPAAMKLIKNPLSNTDPDSKLLERDPI
jgi:hypothetical protein